MASMALDPTPAERTKVIQHATEALDGWANATQWLQQPNPNLDNRTPLEVLFQGSPEDVRKVDELLIALEYGMFP
jgi:uncharacterized protein (DUF2384 family)